MAGGVERELCVFVCVEGGKVGGGGGDILITLT